MAILLPRNNQVEKRTTGSILNPFVGTRFLAESLTHSACLGPASYHKPLRESGPRKIFPRSPKVFFASADNQDTAGFAHAFNTGGPMGSISSVLSAASLTASQVDQLMVDVGFSTTVAGKTYSADVTYSNSEYLAHDANLIGADATGASMTTAENNLINRIDEMV
jgi:hypothetical protein